VPVVVLDRRSLRGQSVSVGAKTGDIHSFGRNLTASALIKKSTGTADQLGRSAA
jgi:hypothetical protein